MNICFDTSPLHTGHAHRGIGAYTRHLSQALQQINDPEIKMHFQSCHQADLDLIHYPFFDLFKPTLPLSFRWPFRHQPRLIVTIHDVTPLIFPEHYPIGIRGTWAGWRQKMAIKGASAIITDSQNSKQDIVKYLHIPEERVFVVYLAAAPQFQPISQSQIDQVKYKYQLPAKYLLYVGDINYNKNIPNLLQALTLIEDNTQLVMVGKNFRPQPIPEWQVIAQAMTPIKQRVKFISDLASENQDDLAAIYAGCETYVQPSLYEGFGLPILEALSCNALVVSSNRGSLPEIGGEAVTYCEPEVGAIADAINKTLSLSATEKRQHQAAGLKQASQFSWSKAAQETVAVYKWVNSQR